MYVHCVGIQITTWTSPGYSSIDGTDILCPFCYNPGKARPATVHIYTCTMYAYIHVHRGTCILIGAMAQSHSRVAKGGHQTHRSGVGA